MPRWTSRYKPVSALFSCDVMLHVLHGVLSRVISGKMVMFKAETALEKVFHLITMGLHEDKLNHEEGDRRLLFVQALNSKSTTPSAVPKSDII